MKNIKYITPHCIAVENMDGELLYSYKTVVVKKSKNGKICVSSFWSSTKGSPTTKRHISKYLHMSIFDVRKKIASGEFDTF